MRIHALIASSLLVIAIAAGPLGAQVTDSSSPNHVFAQFADGRFSDGTFYRSTVVVSSDSLSSISCTSTLFGMTVPDSATEPRAALRSWAVDGISTKLRERRISGTRFTGSAFTTTPVSLRTPR